MYELFMLAIFNFDLLTKTNTSGFGYYYSQGKLFYRKEFCVHPRVKVESAITFLLVYN